MVVTRVPFYRLRLSDDEIGKVVATLKGGWLTTGVVARQFEQEFAEYVHARYAVAVNSCTSALHLSLLAAGIGPNDEVITTPYTFVSSAETILHCGATPVFVDTEANSLNIDLDQVPSFISPRAKALVPVHIAGLPCDLKKVEKLRRKYNLVIVHDAAHALGATYGGRPIGSTADFTCFSFYATKNLTTGEGGMITVNQKRLAERLQLLSLHGMSRNAWRRYTGSGSWRYQILQLGYKYNLSDINASLGLMQLRRFDQLQKKRHRLAEMYRQYLGGIEEIELPIEPPGTTHAWHLYIIKLRSGGERLRNRVIEKLKEFGVGTSMHFIPLFLHPYYQRRIGLKREDFPNSYRHYQSAITLPFYVDLKEAEVKYVASCLKKVLGKR